MNEKEIGTYSTGFEPFCFNQNLPQARFSPPLFYSMIFFIVFSSIDLETKAKKYRDRSYAIMFNFALQCVNSIKCK